MHKTVSNIFYNSLYQVLILFVPLLTIPYVSRVLGTNGVGINALVTSVASFLGTVIVFGMYQLGAREIAKTSPEQRGATFWALWRLQIMAGIIVIGVYIIVTVWFLKSNQLYYLLEIPFLIAYVFDVSWFFVGIGEVKRVILRNTFIKLLSLILIFTLVNSKNDLWIYILILSGTSLAANLFFLISLKGVLPGQKSDWRIRKSNYLKSALMLLLPQIALQFYTNFDGVIVGNLAGNTQLAYYDQSQRIARIIVTILTSASIVIMPKLAGSKNEKSFIRLFNVSLDYTLVFSLFFSSLLMVNAKNFILWYYGQAFQPMIGNMLFVSLIIIFISYGGVFSNQYMLAKGQFTKFSLPYYFGGILNVILNLIFVNLYGANGGTFSLIITEFVVCLSRMYMAKDEVSMVTVISRQFRYVLVFIITLLFSFMFSLPLVSNYFFTIILQSLITAGIFLLGLILLRTPIIMDVQALLKRLRR